MKRLITILALILVSKSTEAFPNGAPIEACRTFRPGHLWKNGHASDASIDADPRALYSLTGVQVGDYFEVSLESLLGNRPFKGFIIRAVPGEFNAANWRTPSMLIGRWRDAEYGRLLDCERKQGSAITHNESSNKKKVSFAWVPPKYRPSFANATASHTVTFVATVVENYGRYWSGLASKPVPIKYMKQIVQRPVVNQLI